jgi:hypothetical protein
MKPCSRNRKLITWLALNALEAGQARELRAHLESCEGCRHYLAEMSSVAGRLAEAGTESGLETTEAFHQKVVAAVRAASKTDGTASRAPVGWRGCSRLAWEGLRTSSRLRLELGGAAVVLVMLAALVLFVWRPGRTPQVPSHDQPGGARLLMTDLAPTLANYQMVANHSLETLDDLLTQQGLRNLAPARTCTAGALVGPDE